LHELHEQLQFDVKDLDLQKTRPSTSRVRDWLLFPPALLYVLVERLFWLGSRRILRRVARLKFVELLQNFLAKLPVFVVLPLFVGPELISHAAGGWASYLLIHGDWSAGVFVVLFVKGTATLIEVWIYESCKAGLLSVRWFAWAHEKLVRAHDWVLKRLKRTLSLAAAGRPGQ